MIWRTEKFIEFKNYIQAFLIFALMGLICTQTLFIGEFLLAESFENFLEEFDILRTQILDSRGFIREGLVDTLDALKWLKAFQATYRIVQWKRLHGIGRYSSDEVDDHIELSKFLLEWINTPGVDDYQKVVRLVIAYKSRRVQDLTQLMEIHARK